MSQSSFLLPQARQGKVGAVIFGSDPLRNFRLDLNDSRSIIFLYG